MLNLNLVLLAFVQGAAEFLPISSSAHLILMPKLMDWADQGLEMDISLHIGTLAAVVIYFFPDVIRMFKGLFRFDRNGGDTRLVLKLAIAVIPALIAGLLIHDHMEEVRSVRLIAFTLIGFGILLYVADRYGQSRGDIDSISYGQALVIGLAQAIALCPGVSRSGITMTAARFLGVKREESARFSMLLSVPTIAAAGCWVAFKIWQSGEALSLDLLYGAFFSCIFGLIAIWSLMKLVKHCSFLIFTVYRVILGMVLLAVA